MSGFVTIVAISAQLSARAQLSTPRRHERRQLPDPIRSTPEGRERAICGLAKLHRELTRARDAAERHERRLSCILADGLACFGGVALHVEQVVDDLERKPQVLGEGDEPLLLVRAGPGGQRAGSRRGDEERPGLASMDLLERLEADLPVGRQQIRRLAADQPIESNRIGQDFRECRRE